VAAFRALARFDDRHRFYTWIFTIARRQCIDLLRRRRDLAPLEQAEELAMEAESAAESAARREDAGRLWADVRTHLPPAQAEALWLVYKDDLSIADAARALGWSQVRLKVTLHRARHRLRTLLSAPATARLTAPLPLLQTEKT
jgi:RNA polymerase sigma-70 factor, ECF subfamily